MAYTVYLDSDIMCSNAAEDTALLKANVSLEANKAGTFTFTMAPNHPFYDSVVEHQSIIDVYQDTELIFSGCAVKESTDFYNRKTVTCEGELSYLNDTIQRPAQYTGETPQTYLAALLTEHNAQCDAAKTYSVGSVTMMQTDLDRVTNYTTTMTAISDGLLKELGGYLRTRTSGGVRYLDYLAASPRTSSQVIRIGQNLLDFAQDFDTTDIATVLIPLGADLTTQTVPGINDKLTVKSVNAGKDYIVSTASAFYGYVWKTKTFDNITTASDLLTAANDYLTDAQWGNLTLKASAFDLGLADSSVQQFRILDKIRVVSAPHNLDRNFMLTKLDIDLNDPGNTKITLGSDTTLSLSTQTAEAAAAIQENNTKILVNAATNAREILESATGGNIYFVYDSNGVCTEIRIMDTNDPLTATYIWRWNINGWGYSDDGGLTYRLAATMNGAISADFITTGTLDASQATITNIDADNITAGTITGLEINNGSGTFKVTNAGTMTATAGTIANWTLSGNKIQSNGGNTYLSSNTGDYALHTSNAGTYTNIAYNGNIESSGSVDLTVNGELKTRGVRAVKAYSSSAVQIGPDTNCLQFYNDSTNGIYMTFNNARYQLFIQNDYLRVIGPL